VRAAFRHVYTTVVFVNKHGRLLREVYVYLLIVRLYAVNLFPRWYFIVSAAARCVAGPSLSLIICVDLTVIAIPSRWRLELAVLGSLDQKQHQCKMLHHRRPRIKGLPNHRNRLRRRSVFRCLIIWSHWFRACITTVTTNVVICAVIIIIIIFNMA